MFDVFATSFLLWRAPGTCTTLVCIEHILIMSQCIILIFTAFIEDILKLKYISFFLFYYEYCVNGQAIVRTFRTPLV